MLLTGDSQSPSKMHIYSSEVQDSMTTPASSEHKPLTLTVNAFAHGDTIPSKFTCDGDDISPQIEWSGIPEGTQSLVLIMEDRDVPKNLRPDGLFVHWILYTIPPSHNGFAEGVVPESQGLNSGGKASYMGPCPPRQYEPSEHRYFFTLYALDIAPSFAVAPNKDAIMSMVQDHILAQDEYMGRYKRQ